MFSILAEGCVCAKMISGTIEGADLVIPINDFFIVKDGKKTTRKYVVVQNDKLKYPVCVYRFSDDEYSALWMSCTHQQTELRAFGDKLQCPAHGSEFSNKGEVQNGPAETPLRSFRVTRENDLLKISLT